MHVTGRVFIFKLSDILLKRFGVDKLRCYKCRSVINIGDFVITRIKKRRYCITCARAQGFVL